MICQKCNALLRKNARFCQQCGGSANVSAIHRGRLIVQSVTFFWVILPFGEAAYSFIRAFINGGALSVVLGLVFLYWVGMFATAYCLWKGAMWARLIIGGSFILYAVLSLIYLIQEAASTDFLVILFLLLIIFVMIFSARRLFSRNVTYFLDYQAARAARESLENVER